MPFRCRRPAWLPLAFAVLLCTSRPAAAEYGITSWTTADGLPQGTVIAIAQSPDGFLWITTLGGLARFDGRTFRTYDTTTNPELPHSRFAGVLVDAAGDLWLTLQTRELLRYSHGRFQVMGTADGLPSPSVPRFLLHRGRLAADTTKGTVVWQDGRFVTEPALQLPAEHAALTFAGITVGHRARWYRDDAGRAYRFENGRLTRTVELPGRFAHEDRAGRVWALAPGTGELVCLEGGTIRRYGRRDGQLHMEFFAPAEDPDGTIWFLSQSGLMRFRDGRFTSYTTAHGLLDDNVRTIFRDREGSHWVGTNSGLSRLVEQPIVSFTAADGLDGDNTYPVLQDRRGAIWIGAWPGLTRYRNGVFERVSAAYQLHERLVTSLMEDRDGTIWIGTLGSGLRKISGDRVETLAVPITAYALHQGRGSDIWMGTQNGLVHYRDNTFVRVVRADGSTGGETSALHEDAAGTLWVGNLAGLARVVNGVLAQVGEEEGFTGTRVRAFHQDSTGSLWIGTYDSGLFRYRDGRFTRFTGREGLPSNGAFRIIEDDQSRFWISSNAGIYRVARADLDSVAERRSRSVTAVLYGREDGMANQECNGLGKPAGIRAHDGRLWFPTQRGVAVINPASVTLNTAPPPVTLLDVSVGGFSTAERDRIEIRAGSREFQARYAALTFVRPEQARYKYRMDGVDADWVDAGVDRTARYADLPYGTLRFRVIAANRDGVWNEKGAGITIVVIPPFYRTTWFAGVTMGLVGLTAFGVHRWRLSAIERRRAVQEAFSRRLIDSQEADRKRIAAELHDGVSQTLVVIKNWAAAGTHTADEAAQRRLDQIAGAAVQALGEVRDVVHELLPYRLEQLGLAGAIRDVATRVSDASGVAIACAFGDVDAALAPEMALRLFRIVQEALNNVVKHAGATHVSLDARVESGSVRLTVRDNGRGFDTGAVVPTTSGHGFGLVGMSERARMMGGAMTIESARGQGTTLVVVVPCAPRGLLAALSPARPRPG